VKFEKLDKDDVKNFITEVSDVRVEPDAIERISAESGGKISDIITTIHRAEAFGLRNSVKSVGVKELWKN